jgi:hypothetical protein
VVPATRFRLFQQRSYRSFVAILCVVASAAAGTVSLWPRAGSFRTEDRNGDGRPDVWRVYDLQGRLSEVAIDTNFDGRSDVHEYYESGVLVSRESDRNFDDRVDLVQQFDYTTHEQARAIEDVDYDGTADLLVLFQSGRPVFSKWAHRVAPAVARGASARSALNPEVQRRAADDPLTPLEDPFRTDLAVKGVSVVDRSSGPIAVVTSGGLPAASKELVGGPASSSALELTGHRYALSAILDPYSSRGPPHPRS